MRPVAITGGTNEGAAKSVGHRSARLFRRICESNCDRPKPTARCQRKEEQVLIPKAEFHQPESGWNKMVGRFLNHD